MTDEVEFSDGDDDNVSYRRLLNMLTEHKEIIITVDNSDVPSVKKGLTALKGRYTQKQKTAGIIASEEVLTYVSYPAKDERGVESLTQSTLHITLGPRKGVKVYDLKLPDPSL